MTAATSGFSIANLVILIALVIVAVPLFQRLRKSVSKNRKRRWVEEGLMDPPAADPETRESSDHSGMSPDQSGKSPDQAGKSPDQAGKSADQAV